MSWTLEREADMEEGPELSHMGPGGSSASSNDEMDPDTRLGETRGTLSMDLSPLTIIDDTPAGERSTKPSLRRRSKHAASARTKPPPPLAIGLDLSQTLPAEYPHPSTHRDSSAPTAVHNSMPSAHSVSVASERQPTAQHSSSNDPPQSFQSAQLFQSRPGAPTPTDTRGTEWMTDSDSMPAASRVQLSARSGRGSRVTSDAAGQWSVKAPASSPSRRVSLKASVVRASAPPTIESVTKRSGSSRRPSAADAAIPHVESVILKTEVPHRSQLEALYEDELLKPARSDVTGRTVTRSRVSSIQLVPSVAKPTSARVAATRSLEDTPTQGVSYGVGSSRGKSSPSTVPSGEPRTAVGVVGRTQSQARRLSSEIDAEILSDPRGGVMHMMPTVSAPAMTAHSHLAKSAPQSVAVPFQSNALENHQRPSAVRSSRASEGDPLQRTVVQDTWHSAESLVKNAPPSPVEGEYMPQQTFHTAMSVPETRYSATQVSSRNAPMSTARSVAGMANHHHQPSAMAEGGMPTAHTTQMRTMYSSDREQSVEVDPVPSRHAPPVPMRERDSHTQARDPAPAVARPPSPVAPTGGDSTAAPPQLEVHRLVEREYMGGDPRVLSPQHQQQVIDRYTSKVLELECMVKMVMSRMDNLENKLLVPLYPPPVPLPLPLPVVEVPPPPPLPPQPRDQSPERLPPGAFTQHSAADAAAVAGRLSPALGPPPPMVHVAPTPGVPVPVPAPAVHELLDAFVHEAAMVAPPPPPPPMYIDPAAPTGLASPPRLPTSTLSPQPVAVPVPVVPPGAGVSARRKVLPQWRVGGDTPAVAAMSPVPLGAAAAAAHGIVHSPRLF